MGKIICLVSARGKLFEERKRSSENRKLVRTFSDENYTWGTAVSGRFGKLVGSNPTHSVFYGVSERYLQAFAKTLSPPLFVRPRPSKERKSKFNLCGAFSSKFFESHLCHTFDSQKFLAGAPKRTQDGGMKTLPQNIVPFVLRGLPPLNELDQSMMRKLRKLADLTGWTVEDLIHEGILKFVAKREAERELETKIIRFPK